MNAGRILLLSAILAALFWVVGCGGSSGSEVTVQTGSLSKAAFIKKADTVCQKARGKLIAAYFSFLKTHEATAKSGGAHAEEVLITKTVNSVLAPNIEAEIKQISELGAPDDYAPEVASFLNLLQERIDKAQENPYAISKTSAPFKQASDVAKQAGLNGCAESFG